MSKKKNLIIILNEPYPIGMACTQRIHLYAKGLVKKNISVKIIIPKPKYLDRSIQIDVKGEYEGIPYEYSNKSPYRSNSFIKRRWTDFIGPIRAMLKSIRANPDSILMVGGMLCYVVLFKLASMVTHSRLLREKSEVPYMEQETITKRQKRYLKLTFSLFDGILTITEGLAKYFKEDLKIKVETYTIPILIEDFPCDWNRKNNNEASKYILYTGSLIERKDGIQSILESFAIASKAYPELKLLITGNAKQSDDYQEVKRTIEKLSLHQQVQFTGFVSKSRLRELMVNAALLILIKPNNRQNQYNFPTKIGEYLSSGTPVLCTETPILEAYFSNEKNMFLCRNKPSEIGRKIIEILESPQEAKIVGEQGRQFAKQTFDYELQAEKLKEFIFYAQ